MERLSNRHDVSLRAERNRIMVTDVLLVAVLNDWTLDTSERKLKE